MTSPLHCALRIPARGDHCTVCTVDFLPQFLLSLRNIKRSFYESQKWYFVWANWWFCIKTDQLWQRKQIKRSLLMPNHQLAHGKYQFCDSCNERLMFRSETKNVEKIIRKKCIFILKISFSLWTLKRSDSRNHEKRKFANGGSLTDVRSGKALCCFVALARVKLKGAWSKV